MVRDKDDSSHAERQLIVQLHAIDQRISDLQQERLALQRLLARVRQKSVELKDVTRVNSIDRVLLEEKILDTLRQSKKPMKASDIFTVVKSNYYQLKENTFRSHIHRLNNKGLIKRGEKYGTWTVQR